MRTIAHLNDNWRYAPDFKEEYLSSAFDDAAFESVRLPHANVELAYNNFDERAFQFTCCYRRELFVAGEARGQRMFLHFEGAMACAKVYINGELSAEHLGGYTPFTVELTGRVHYGEKNLVAVELDAAERPDVPPFGGVIDYLTYGGLYREVWLEQTGPAFISDLYARPTRERDGWRLEVAGMIDNAAKKIGACAVQLTLGGREGTVLSRDMPLALSGKAQQGFSFALDVGKIDVWDVDDPALYALTLRLVENGEALDETSRRIGFRTARFEADGFRLNDRKLKLRGLNRHQSYPYVGYAMPKSAQYRDAEILKYELGVNIVRTSHYPQSKHFLERCDELGLLVFEEIPGWQHIGGTTWKKVALNNVEEMIVRDRNHPSIVLWGVRINESQDDDDFYKETNARAHSLDPTRQTGGVRNFEFSHLFEDVYTYNDFLHQGNNAALSRPEKVTKTGAPYLVTEHNGHMFPTKKFDCEEKRVEHALRHLRVLNAAYGSERISGAIGWCMADYNTHKDFGNGDLVCYHGVLDMFRLPKEAAAAYASQGDGRVVMEVASGMNRGERDASRLERLYVFTNCDCVKMYRNDEFIGVYYPDCKGFPHLPHPPVVISDFVGGLLERNEGMSHSDAERVKRVFAAVVKYGDKSLPLRYQLEMGIAMLKRRMSYKDAVDLFFRYVADWGCESVTYAFEGYKDGHLVASCRKGPAPSCALEALPDRTELREEETYDVCRVALRHIDALGNPMTYSCETVAIDVSGAGERIGPRTVTLAGGSTAFWVKTKGKGSISVKVTSERFGEQTLTLASV
ncbi:MAG TPA: glycoside hydrolase family 2 TIM barrel-domain containing protein [Clostridia bacterium]|nr:glycoside hydrolase family 2 TIM barrel-domain containing protein [Clostridia bacterium]